MTTVIVRNNSLTSKEYTLLLVSTLVVMAGATIAPALPEIAKAFPFESELSIQLIITITALFTAVGSLFMGNLIDKYGRKKPLIYSIFIFGFSGSSGLYLNTVEGLLISRAILGLAVAGIMTITVTLIGDYYTGEFRNKIVGLQASFMTFGGVLFIFFGGLLAEINWHFPFGIFLISFFLLLGVIYRIDEPERVFESHDKFSESEHEYSLIAHTKVLLFAYSIGFITVLLFYFIIIFLPFYLGEEFSRSPFEIGVALSINSLFAAFASLNYNRIKSKFHYHSIFGLLFIFLSMGGLVLSTASNFLFLIFGLVLFGLGLGLFIPNINSWLFGQTHSPIRGRVIGGFSAALFLGQFISPIVGNILLTSTSTSGLFLISSGIFLLFAILFFINAYLADKDHS